MSRFLTGLFAALALLISGVPAAAQSIGYSPNTLPLSGSCGTVTISTPCLDLSQTWNAGGVTFTGLKLNVTDTASAAGSLLADLQVGGASKFTVTKAGSGTFINTVAAYGTGGFYSVNDAGGFNLGLSSDVALRRDAANTLALRNGTAAQQLNIYETYTDASNYETLQIGASLAGLGTNTFGVVAKGAGTGSTTRPIYFGTLGAGQVGWVASGITRWIMDASGNLTANADNTYDIGASGANRPRNVYVAGTILAGSSITGANMIAFDAGSIGWNSRIRMFSAVDGTLRITNNAGTITTDITLSGASAIGGSMATFGGTIVAGGTVRAAASSALEVASRVQIGSPSNGVFRFGDGTSANYQDVTLGSGGANTTLTFGGGIKTTGATFALQTATTLTDNAAAQVATMTNGPTAGNPTKWIAINDNGTTRYIPAW